MANAAVTVGSGEHRVLALHGWFGSALVASIEGFLGQG